MEIIEPPATQEEKLAIATKYLVQRQLKANGLQDSQVSLSEAAIAAVIDGYTREAGVRNLERAIGGLLRHAAMRIAEGTADKVAIDAGDVPAILAHAASRTR
jgi:ATP-dependent Lon protease